MSTTTLTNEEIIEAIKNKPMIEVAGLVKELEEVFGVSAAAPVMAVSGASAEDTSEKAAEQTEFTVILTSPGGSKIPVIKEVRAITGLELKKAKEVVETSGKAIKENLSKEEAQKLKSSLRLLELLLKLNSILYFASIYFSNILSVNLNNKARYFWRRSLVVNQLSYSFDYGLSYV